MYFEMILMCMSLLCSGALAQQDYSGNTTTAPPAQPPPTLNASSATAAATTTSSPAIAAQTTTSSPPPPTTTEIPVCVKRASCASWHNVNSTHAAQVDARWNCYCDELCEVYGDCCEDYKTYFQPNPKISALPEGSFGCEYMDLKNSGGRMIHMVTQCPRQWPQNDSIAQQCHETRTTDFFLQWPVSDANGVAFKNVFCSICHGRSTEDVVYWKADFACQNIPQEDAHLDIRTLVQNETYCQRKGWMLPDDLKFRECRTYYVKSCPPTYSDTHVIAGCVNGSTSIVYSLNIFVPYIYKNEYCAQCHGEMSYDCEKFFFKSAPGIVGNDLGLYPMSLLLDLNSGSGKYAFESRVGRIQSKTDQVDVKLKQCPEHKVYDPFAGLCRLVGCGTGYQLIQDKCVPLNAHDGNSSCLSHVLNETEYTILSSGELYVNSSGELLDIDEYEANSDGSILVCTNWTRNYTTGNDPFMGFKFDDAQTILSMIGQLISLIALAIHFIVYLLLPSLQNLAGKNLMCLVASLFVAQFFFLFGIGRANIYELCFFIAVVIHYAFLASFFWMNVISVDIFRTFSKRTKAVTSDQHHRLFTRYSIFAWLGPAVIVSLTIILDVTTENIPIRPGYGAGLCWITSRWALLLLFGLPVLVIVLSNTLLFSLTIKNLCQLAQDTKSVSKSSDKQRLLLYIKLSTIMGLTWLFGFLATLTDVQPLWYVFILLNSLQGLFICLAFVCNAKTLRLLRENYVSRRDRRASDGTRSTLVSSSTSNEQKRTSRQISNV